MPDHAAKRCHGSDNSKQMFDNMKGEDSMKPSQSSWTAHWMRSSNNSELPIHKKIVVHDVSYAENNGIRKRYEPIQIGEARKFTRLDVDVDLEANLASKNTLRYGGIPSSLLQSAKSVPTDEGCKMLKLKNLSSVSEIRPSPVLNSTLKLKSFMESKAEPAICHGDMVGKYGIEATPVGMSGPPVPLAVCMPEKLASPSVAIQFPDQWIKRFKSVEKKSSPDSRPFREELKRSTSDSSKYLMPDESKYQGSTVEKSSFREVHEEHNYSANFTHPAQSCCKFAGPSIEKCRNPSYLRQKNHFMPPSDHLSDTGSAELKNLHRMPTCSVHDVETIGLSTSVDSVEGIPGGPSKFSKKTHHLLITKKTDTCFSKGKQAAIDSTLPEELKRSAFYQPTRKSSRADLLGEEFQRAYCKPCDGMRKGSSSAQCGDGFKGHSTRSSVPSDERNHTDIDPCLSRYPTLGITSSRVHKDILAAVVRPTKSQATVASPREEARSRNLETQIPDKNELPTSSAALRSIDDRELSPSRTESLEAEHLLLHVERSESSNSSFQQNSPLPIDPSSRWFKRLRSSSSEALGTKNSNMGDISSREEAIKLFSRILNYRRACPELIFGTSLGKRQQLFDKTKVLRHYGEASSVDLRKDTRDVTLIHSWIQRWRHGGPQVGPARVGCEPGNSKVPLEDFHGKQFPSIAAMALMGKAMNDFRPCEFRKRGSMVVWNS